MSRVSLDTLRSLQLSREPFPQRIRGVLGGYSASSSSWLPFRRRGGGRGACLAQPLQAWYVKDTVVSIRFCCPEVVFKGRYDYGLVLYDVSCSDTDALGTVAPGGRWWPWAWRSTGGLLPVGEDSLGVSTPLHRYYIADLQLQFETVKYFKA